MQKEDFLFELGCEELPIAAVRQLGDALQKAFVFYLDKYKLSYDRIQWFATPRRLAVLVMRLDLQQPSFSMERIGPSIEAAYAKDGSPSIAFLGFAKSCEVSIDQISVKETSRGKKLYCMVDKPGKLTQDLLPEIITQAMKRLNIGKAMRWNNSEYVFARPVHWLLALLGSDIILIDLFGIAASNLTFGHRFHSPRPLMIDKPKNYADILIKKGFVIPNFEVRKNLIRKLAIFDARKQGNLLMDDDLLNEVTSLVEWPVAYLGHFNDAFLKTPKEALIASMKKHQRCFPVVNDSGDLLPYFVIISNIESKNPNTVIEGNEKVINARLADATFFYKQDTQRSLDSRLPKLKSMLFHEKLGSMWDKAKRIERLVVFLAKQLDLEAPIAQCAKRAAMLSKCDLTSELVCEFPTLQGIAGYYYAKHDKESNNCALAIYDHYKPSFSKDTLPRTIEGQLIALADKIDTLVSIIGLNLLPTGDKDPFALRRAALGIVRMSIEKQLSFDLKSVLEKACKNFHLILPNKNTVSSTFDFIIQRLKVWYLDQGASLQQFMSVYAVNPTNLADFDKRLKAVSIFVEIPEAKSLATANKRVFNILKKQPTALKTGIVDPSLFEVDAEKVLYKLIQKKAGLVEKLSSKYQYREALMALAEFKLPVDTFFEDVLVMVKDKRLQKNRLALLSQLRQLLIKVADIAYLS